MILLSNSIANKKTKKKQKTPHQQKKTTAGEEEDFFNTVSPLVVTFAIKKNVYCVTFRWSFLPLILQGRRCRYCVTYTCHSLICFSTCCRALDTTPTVPPLPDTVYLILSRKSTLLNCVTYTWLSSCKKRPGQYRKKFNILPASAASQALQNPVSLHRTRQSKKKI